MTFHPRTDWTKTPAADAHRVDPDALRGVAIHWNGPAVPKSALKDPRSYLEGVRRFHTGVREWSDIAYNFAVDQNGDVWELRGRGHKSGANGDEHVNTTHLAILCVIGEGQIPSPAMVAGVGRAVARVRAKYPQARQVVGHCDLRVAGTACPGKRLYNHVESGAFRPKPPCEHCPTHCPPKEKP